MLFSAGMGIGLVFYGAAEPMADFAAPPTAEPQTKAAYTEALRLHFSIGVPCMGNLRSSCTCVSVRSI